MQSVWQKINPEIRLTLKLIVVGFAMVYIVCPNCSHTFRNYVLVGTFCSLVWIALWIGNAHLANLITRFVSWTEQPTLRFGLGFVGTIIYTLSAIYLLTVGFNWVASFDISFEKDMLYSTVAITFTISAIMHGRSFLQSWKQAALDAETSKKESAIARYESLKNQINPHFLFNSLNALTSLVYEDQDKAAKFIKQLSDVYRYVLDTREKELVTLEEELHFVQSYLFLQQIRFGTSLKVNINLKDVRGKVAPLALQLLIENAIKHNVVSVDDPLFIEVVEENGFIGVINNLQKKNEISENGTGLGLENIRSRYKFLTDKEITVSEADGKFSVRLPLIEMEGA